MLEFIWVACAAVIISAAVRAKHSTQAARTGRWAVPVLYLAAGAVVNAVLLEFAAAIAFHVALLSLGWGFYLWSIPMIGALSLLLRAELQTRLAPVAREMSHARAA